MVRPTVVAIIQARMNSSRLPGKVLADLGGRTMLARVVRRVRRASLVDRLVIATSCEPDDDPIQRECERLAAACFRGSASDVLDRYQQAATAHAAEVVVRITADCPLIDPGESDRVIRAFLDCQPDYASNVLRRTYPRGLDTEVLGAATLAHAWLEARQPYERVHVTPYIYGHPETFRLLSITGRENRANGRWTVDTPEDLAMVRAIYRRFDNDDAMGWREVQALLDAEPELAGLNGHVQQKALVEG
jgi:spore coat polysaccharide biosynthesis protein SpsF